MPGKPRAQYRTCVFEARTSALGGRALLKPVLRRRCLCCGDFGGQVVHEARPKARANPAAQIPALDPQRRLLLPTSEGLCGLQLVDVDRKSPST